MGTDCTCMELPCCCATNRLIAELRAENVRLREALTSAAAANG